jgi:L-iditol 2-dehydrogenase
MDWSEISCEIVGRGVSVIPHKMQAVVKYAPLSGKTELREVDVPGIGPKDALVRVEAVGICGSDPHIHQNKFAFPIPTPIILGHEFSGVVVSVGSEVVGFSVGDRVTAETHASYCGRCALCRTGNYQVCKERKGFGFHVDGAFAEYVRVPQMSLHHLPDSVSYEAGSLTEPLCVAYNAVVEKSNVRPGDTVIVIGPGPIGILCTEMARLSGAAPIIVIGITPDADRMEIARAAGATHCINSDTCDIVTEVMRITAGVGAEVVIDTAGVGDTLKHSMQIVTPGGTITKVGWGPEPVGYTIDPIIQKAVTLRGSFSHSWPIWERCLKLMSLGQVHLESLITHTLPLSDWLRGFELIESRQALKVVLKPGQTS